MIRHMKGLIITAVVLALAACGSTVKKPSPKPVAAAPAQFSYVIEPGDELDVRFFYNPELNEEVMVRPDGGISLPLVGQVQAAGRTVTDLEGALRQQYSGELRQAAITVIVKGFAGQRVYVDGEVRTPMMVNIAGNLTAMQAVASAGGFTDDARKEEVVIIRRSAGAAPMVIPLNLARTIDGTDTSQDIALHPYDVVFVPKTGIAEVNQWVDQYIRKNIPIPFGLGYGLNN